jgi:hypothetical protein
VDGDERGNEGNAQTPEEVARENALRHEDR